MLIAVLAIVIALAGSAAFAWRAMGSDSAAECARDLHQISRETFDIDVNATGELEARNQTEIRSQLETPAAIVYVVDEGKMVNKGDLLVELASDSIENQIEDETLRVEEARNNLIAAENAYDIQVSENDAALRQSQLKLELSQIAYDKWNKGDLVKQREQLELAIEKAKRQLDRWTDKYAQSQKLYKSEFLSLDELKQDEIQLLQAKADVKTADRNKWVFETFELDQKFKQLRSDVEEAKAEIERVKQQNASRLASKEADRANRKRTLSIREDRLAKLEEQLKATKMYATTDGLVVYATSTSKGRGMIMMGSSEQIEIGKNVRPNETIIVLPDTSEMVASVRVHESMAGKVHRGQATTVRIDALPNQAFTGKVIDVSVLAESGGWRDPNLREYTVKIGLDADNANMTLKPAMRVEAEIQINQSIDQLAVPLQAIFHEGRIAYVYKEMGGGRFTRTPIKVGERSDTTAQILAGLEEGDSVLLREPSPASIEASEFDPKVIARFYPENEAAPATSQSNGARSLAFTSAAGGDQPAQFVAGSNGHRDGRDRQRSGARGRGDMAAFAKRLVASVEKDDPALAKELREIGALKDKAQQGRRFRELISKHPELMQNIRQSVGGGQGQQDGGQQGRQGHSTPMGGQQD